MSSRESWYERIKTYGKDAVILEEMLKLGFWPPEDGATEKRNQALAQLEIERAEIQQLNTELRKVEKRISDAGNMAAMLDEIRKLRIARVRAAREQRKLVKAQELVERREAVKKRRLEKPTYLGEGVSAGLRYEGGNAEKLTELGLPKLETAAELAAAIGIEPGKLSWLTYHRGASTNDHYSRFTIPKRSGGVRVISSPKKDLRVAQSWVLKNILEKLAIHDAAMAFRPARSILDNAKQHQGRAVVIKIDLKDFFPSIRFPRVKGLFRSFGYNEGLATLLALLTTEAPRVQIALDGKVKHVATGERQLPQGACTSPMLTNILCRQLDKRLSGVAAKFGFRYTRYADDLVFSHESKDVQLGQFLTFVRKVVTQAGFVVNEDKTRIMRPHQRQAVTGLVVNGQPTVSRKDLHKFRAFLHKCETKGVKAVSEEMGKNAAAYAKGYLAFIHMSSPEKAAKIRAKYSWLA